VTLEPAHALIQVDVFPGDEPDIVSEALDRDKETRT
jgi:hypothetical protein